MSYMIPIAEPDLEGNELAYVTDCIRKGWISSRGSYVAKFEEIIADWCGVSHAISNSSGTSATHLALLAVGVGLGDKVILPALTYVATANLNTFTGARPIFVGVDPYSWNLNLDHVVSSITTETKAIFAGPFVWSSG
jgi:perosamine synthetase